ncbi:MAG: hypothetical protein MJ093_01635 [Saccharofermentans sp.]|nr:hypothetical protein [Saccharofermentans sp.]
MPSKQFEQLSEDKKNSIIEACLIEFAQSGVINASTSEIFQKIIDYSVWETSWYIDNPVKGRFVIAVASEKDSAFVEKLQTRFGAKSENVYLSLMSELNMENIKVDAITLM